MIVHTLLTNFAASCSGGDILGFPKWYQYLDGQMVNGSCSPVIHGLSDVWLIVAAAIEILLRIASIVADVVVVIGGIRFIVSQGEPENASKARATIINAVIGLAITIIASVGVSFIAGSIR